MTKKKRIYILCPYPFDVAPSQRLKMEQYYPAFKQAGFELKISPFISNSFWKIIYKKGHFFTKFFFTLQGYLRRLADLIKIPFYDIVYVHLWVTPFGFPLFERLTRLLSKHLIYDIDDMIYLKDHGSRANPIISAIKGKNKPVYLFRRADYVITSASAIEQFARRLNNNVVHVPITIDTTIYTQRANYEINEQIVLGWTGSYSTSNYLHLLDEVLLELRRLYDFKLYVMGDENFSIEGIDVKAVPWNRQYEVETIRSFDIGLYPLPDEEWVLGKGGGKALQYMALGIPTVATAIGVNFQVIENGVSGFLVKEKKEWIEALEKLISDPSLRKKMGFRARKRVEKMFSIEANKDTYLSVLGQVIGK